MDNKDTGCGSPVQGSLSATRQQGEHRQNQESIRPSTRDGTVGHTKSAGGGHPDHVSAKANKSSQQHKVSVDNRIGRLVEVRQAQQPFAIERYLQEGDQAEAFRRRDREGYSQGSPGMRQYLRDWQTTWNDTYKKATG